MLYKLNVEYRELAVLRLRLLKEVQSNNGIIPVEDFKKLFACIIKNSNGELKTKFTEAIKLNNEHVSYHKLSTLINKFQYNPFCVK